MHVQNFSKIIILHIFYRYVFTKWLIISMETELFKLLTFTVFRERVSQNQNALNRLKMQPKVFQS